MTKFWWIPVKTVACGYLRVQATTAEEAIEKLEAGAFSEDELIEMDIDSCECTGAPQEEKVA